MKKFLSRKYKLLSNYKYSSFLISNRFVILFIFLILILASVYTHIYLKSSFLTGIGDIKKSDSLYVKETINNSFQNQIPNDLIIVSNDNNYNKEKLYNLLKSESNIKEFYNTKNNQILENLLNKNSDVYLIKLKKNLFSDYEKFTPIIRQKIKEIFPNSKIYVTGNASFSYDMNFISEKEGKEAEIKVLLVTLIVLFLAFGSISGSIIVVSSGFISTLLTISILKIICLFYPLSIFSQNISTMLGLGLSIDYSLLMISRLRQEIKLNTFDIAFDNTVKYVSKAILLSGITVMIGFIALFIPNLNISNSIAVGGSIISCIAIMTSIIYVPIMLYITKKYLNYPFNLKEKSIISEKFGNFIIKNSFLLSLITIIILITIMFPVLRIKLSEPEISTMPENMESKQGFIELNKISKANIFYPIQIILESYSMIDEIEAYRLSEKLKKYPFSNIFTIFGDLKNTNYTEYYLLKNSGIKTGIFSSLEEYFLSKDKKKLLITIFPIKSINNYQINSVIKDLKKIKDNDFKIFVGGQSALGYDLIENLYRNFHLIIIFIYTLTFIVLFFAYKSILIPIKAIIVNTFSVLACYGLLVLVFQDGYFNNLFNLKYPPNYIISGIPIILFCIMFSLSMDYEVFLLSSIYEEYQKTEDNKKSIISGLIKTSGTITKAAVIMLIVFIAFIQADIILIKMLGVGLTFAVLIDSTIIRLILVPSLMNLAGKYNWTRFL
ncbi:MAG: MMPL family transporter [Candidatus Sericytochromatia bacterium]